MHEVTMPRPGIAEKGRGKYRDVPLITDVQDPKPVPTDAPVTVRRGLVAILPDLRGFARFLTRDVSAADDLVQETIVRALASQAQFRPGTSLKAWLFTIQRNAFYEQRRRRKREDEILDGMGQDGSLAGHPLSEPGRHDDVSDLTTLLWKLPDIFREALILVGAQEMTHEEAATVCGVPVGTMKARVSRARAQLAELAAPQLATG